MQTCSPWNFKCCDTDLTENFDNISDMINIGLTCPVCGREYDVYVSHMEYDDPIYEVVEKQAELIDNIQNMFFPPQSVTSFADEVDRARRVVDKIVFTDVEIAGMIMEELRERKD